jgi:hypothetical protein
MTTYPQRRIRKAAASTNVQHQSRNSRASSRRKFWAYEVELRSEWFDQRPRFNATAYYSDVGGLDDGPGGSLGEVVKRMGPPRQWGLGGNYGFW